MSRYSDLELLSIRVDTLFTRDSAGGLVGVNKRLSRPAPHCFLQVCPSGWTVEFAGSIPPEIRTRIESILREPTWTPSLQLPEELIASITDAFERPIVLGGGPVYRFPGRSSPSDGVSRVTLENLSAIQKSFEFEAIDLEHEAPCFAVIEDGQAISICFSSRNVPSAAEAGVDTIEAARGRGFAPLVVSAWAAGIQASGREPLYSTWWANRSSQRVAEKLGLIHFASDASWTLS